jgi:Fic/DOC family
VPTRWEEPPESRPLIEANTQRVVTAIAAQADARQPPTVAMAQQWHRELYDFAPGVPAKQVPAELSRFEGAAQLGAQRLDASISAEVTAQQLDTAQLHGVLLYCANLHGLWVRIHPFANGNGRIARLWVVWASLRYGLPPFIRIKPRPDGSAYAAAAAAAMYGDYDVMVPVLDQMLRSYLTGLPR